MIVPTTSDLPHNIRESILTGLLRQQTSLLSACLSTWLKSRRIEITHGYRNQRADRKFFRRAGIQSLGGAGCALRSRGTEVETRCVHLEGSAISHTGDH